MTAVEWLYKWFNDNYESTIQQSLNSFNMAKKLEKQEIKDAYNQGYREGLEDCGNVWMTDKDVSECSNAEIYYNEIFKASMEFTYKKNK